MGELTEEEHDAAVRRGEIGMATKPRARSARYDRATGRIVVELVNGVTFALPASLAQDLENATPDLLAQVEVLGVGFGLHWEELDVDFSVEGVMAARFGTARYMRERSGWGPDAQAAE